MKSGRKKKAREKRGRHLFGRLWLLAERKAWEDLAARDHKENKGKAGFAGSARKGLDATPTGLGGLVAYPG